MELKSHYLFIYLYYVITNCYYICIIESLCNSYVSGISTFVSAKTTDNLITAFFFCKIRQYYIPVIKGGIRILVRA